MATNPSEYFKDFIEAFERKKIKLKTFETGDRVIRPRFSLGFNKGPSGYDNGIFIEAVPPVDCMILWEGDSEPELTPVSIIQHANNDQTRSTH